MPSFGQNLETERARALELVNEIVGQAQSKWLTPHKETVYRLQLAEAEAYLAATPEPASLAAFPFIAGKSKGKGIKPNVMALQIKAGAEASARGLAALEERRETALAAILAAATVADIRAAVAQFSKSVPTTKEAK